MREYATVCAFLFSSSVGLILASTPDASGEVSATDTLDSQGATVLASTLDIQGVVLAISSSTEHN